jgi:hypothetical protein
LTASIGLTLVDLFYGVNLERNVITFIPDFPPTVQVMARRTDALLAEMKETERYKRAMAKYGLTEVN